jgi:phosphate transport system substrate-binding protein
MKRFSLLVLCLTLCLTLASALPTEETVSLVGCGSVIPKALYGAWADAYAERAPQVHIKYLPLGSSEGIKQMTAGSADFGGGEIPISDEEMRATGKDILQLPLFLTAVVPVYNVPGPTKSLRFSGKVLGDIFSGKIKSWNHPDLVKLNPGVQLPDLAITVLHREPGKGTTYLLTEFLSKTNPAFRAQIGISSSPNWPVGLTAQGGEGMVRQVKEVPGAIGYAELNVAKDGGVSIGQVQNLSGAFVTATPEGAAAACPRNLRRKFDVSLTNMPGENVYPITGFTWMFVPAKGASAARSKALNGFLKFIFTDGQSVIAIHGHMPLPQQITSSVLETLNSRD